MRLGGVLSCASAAQLYDLPLLSPSLSPHVTVPRNWSKAVAPGVVVHRRDLDPDDVNGVATTVEQTVVDIARELPFPDAVVVGDAALHRGACPETIASKVHAMRGPGSPQARRVLHAADGRAESAIETVLRLLASPLGQLEPQVVIRRAGRVDLLVDGWLVLEADGFAYHSDRQAYREDRRRANALAAAGYVLLRFTYEDVVHRPEYVIAIIRAVVRNGPPPGFAPRHTEAEWAQTNAQVGDTHGRPISPSVCRSENRRRSRPAGAAP